MSTLLRELDIWHLRWALRELHPADQRVPAIVLRLHTTGRIKVGGIGLYPDFVHVDIRQLLQPGARLALW